MKIQNFVEYFILRILAGIILIIGLKNSYKLAFVLSRVFFYLIPIRKKTSLENISRAFPGKNKTEVKNILKGSYESFCVTLFELFYFKKLKVKRINELADCENIELVQEKLSEKKGLLFLTAHYGNWELAAVWTAAKLGMLIKVLAKPQRNSLVNEWINHQREICGNKVIQLGVSIREMYVNLKEGNAVGVVGDQRGPVDGVRVNFFNIPTSTYPGTASLALKLQTPIVCMFFIRTKNYKYKTTAYEIDTSKLKGSNEGKIQQINQIYMSHLEDTIRKNPEQWFWMHKIWKY